MNLHGPAMIRMAARAVAALGRGLVELGYATFPPGMVYYRRFGPGEQPADHPDHPRERHRLDHPPTERPRHVDLSR